MKVCWVKIWIASMATLTERFRDDEGRVDFEALGREEYAFRHALITGDYYKSERARDLAEAAEKDYKIHSENGKKGGRPKKLTAAATTSDGVDVVPDRESGSLVRTTGCDPLTADAPHREAGENVTDGSNAGKRESGTSANHYGKEQDEALDKPGAGEVPPENVSAKPSPALPVLEFGEFGNIKMTNMQYAKLCERFGCADTVIEEADQYFEAQPAKKKKYKNHYAMLLNWCKRRETEAKPVQGRRFETAADRDREEIQKIADYYAAQERGENPPMPKIQLVEGL